MFPDGLRLLHIGTQIRMHTQETEERTSVKTGKLTAVGAGRQKNFLESFHLL